MKRSARRHSATRISLILLPVVICSGVLDAQQFDRQDTSTRSIRACATAAERDAASSQYGIVQVGSPLNAVEVTRA